MFPNTKFYHFLMFPNTKLALDVARNVSTIIKTFINIVAARHEIIRSRHATTQQLYRRKILRLKKKSNTSKISIKIFIAY